MIRFNCDYLEGAHPRIMEKLMETNFVQTPGYGEDEFCERARAVIREKCGTPDAYVQFLVGGTQTNLTVIASVLRPYQGVLSAVTGHINAHETGAIEAEGITAQAEQVMKNLSAVLDANGLTFEDAIKTTCFLADMGDFAVFNEVYGKYFTSKPARSCVAVKTLPKNVLCEVEVIALMK